MNRGSKRARYRRADGTHVLGAQLLEMTDQQLLVLYRETRADCEALEARMMTLSHEQKANSLEMEGAKALWRLARLFRTEAALILIDREINDTPEAA